MGMQMSLRSGVCFCWVGFIPFKALAVLQVPQWQHEALGGFLLQELSPQLVCHVPHEHKDLAL